MLKPAGIPVFPPHADPDGDCVLRRLLIAEPQRDQLGFPEAFAGGIAHRLDTSTSGALLVADSPAELAEIRTAFTEKTLTKTYRLRTGRTVPWDENRCTLALAHDKKRKRRMVVQRGQNTPHRGRWHPAETRFRRMSDDLFEAEMNSGVMHQVRLHAAFLGIALLGDAMYGGGPTPEDAPDGLVFYLHHVGLRGPRIATEALALPSWAQVDT